MRFKISAVLFLACIIVLSVFVARILSVIRIDDHFAEEGDSSFTFRGLKNNDDEIEGVHNNSQLALIPGDSPDHLMWFLQISDIHISIFHDLSRVSDLKEFCSSTVDVIQPAVVLASGDLTDAKSADNMGSRQYVQEWIYYRNVLEECKVRDKTVWLDVRGNHDNFNVPDLHSSENYYRNFSIQGARHLRSYMTQVRQGQETYSFIAVDAALNPGPRRPFNFIGVLGLHEFDQLREFANRANHESNFSIWFGHYPTSCVLAPDQGLRQLIGKSGSLAYMCGHLHMLGGVVPNMYTLQQAGYLELELADWKDNRRYRLAAIDHGLFSFTDVTLGKWPIILVTNPKHALYVMPTREPISHMHNSTHIRVMVFSLAPILKVLVRVGDDVWQQCQNVKGPLYVLPWNTSHFSTGLHSIHVHAEDMDGREHYIEQPFALDDTRLTFGLLPRIALMTNASVMFQCMFGAMLIICIVPLCILRLLHLLVKKHKIRRPRRTIPILHWWLRKLWILSTVDRLFYPLTLYALYLTVGPWSIGEVIEGHTGVIFAWGILIHGAYLPGSLTYAYGFLQMATFQFPLILFLAHCVDHRFHTLHTGDQSSTFRYFVRHTPFVCIVALQIALAYFFWLAYGTLAFLLGPLRTWAVILAIILWCQTVTLPERCLRIFLNVSYYTDRHPVTNAPWDQVTYKNLFTCKCKGFSGGFVPQAVKWAVSFVGAVDRWVSSPRLIIINYNICI